MFPVNHIFNIIGVVDGEEQKEIDSIENDSEEFGWKEARFLLAEHQLAQEDQNCMLWIEHQVWEDENLLCIVTSM